jgi:hypothetical protein
MFQKNAIINSQVFDYLHNGFNIEGIVGRLIVNSFSLLCHAHDEPIAAVSRPSLIRNHSKRNGVEPRQFAITRGQSISSSPRDEERF